MTEPAPCFYRQTFMKQTIVALALAVTAACNAGPEAPVANAPGSQPPQQPQTRLQVATPGLADARPTSIDRVSFEGDRSKLRVVYWTGVEDCYGLDRVEQQWTKDALRLRVFTGRKQLPQNTACIDIAVSATTIVSLQQELGNRIVIDGSSGQRVSFR